jgi:hypothetical protein
VGLSDSFRIQFAQPICIFFLALTRPRGIKPYSKCTRSQNQASLQILNEEFEGLAYPAMIRCTGRGSHMFDARMNVSFLEEAGTENVRMERARLNLQTSDKMALLLDPCKSSFAVGEKAIHRETM